MNASKAFLIASPRIVPEHMMRLGLTGDIISRITGCCREKGRLTGGGTVRQWTSFGLACVPLRLTAGCRQAGVSGGHARSWV